MNRRIADDLDQTTQPEWRDVDLPARNVTQLHAPNGDTLITISDTPPVGFHQGQRGSPRIGYTTGHEQ